MGTKKVPCTYLPVILLWAVTLSNAQQSVPRPDLSVDPPKAVPVGGAVRFSEGEVTFEPFSLSKDPVIADLLVGAANNPDLANSFRFSGHLSNSSGKSIAGMTSISTWADSSGTLREYTAWSDVLLQYGGKIYPEEFSGLATGPSSFWLRGADPPAYSISRLFGMITLDDREVRPSADEFRDSYLVKFELDAVILDDGTVLGPGRSQTLNVLKARQEAIDTVSAEMIELLDRQKDPAQALTKYVEKEADLSDPLSFWSARVARIFLAAPNPRAIAAQLSENRNVVLHHKH